MPETGCANRLIPKQDVTSYLHYKYGEERL